MWRVAVLNRLVWIGPIENVTFNQILEGGNQPYR